MKKLTMIIAAMMMVADLFAGTAIYKTIKADGTVKRIVFDSNQKIATFLEFMYLIGSPVDKVTIQTKGTGTFAEASAEKPYYCVKFKNSKSDKMFIWKSDFDEVIKEMKAEEKK